MKILFRIPLPAFLGSIVLALVPASSVPANAQTFASTGPLSVSRAQHTMTVLPNGQVLVAGGYNNTNGYMATAELYDPATGAWTSTGSMLAARSLHTATLLPNGKVLVVGGYNGSTWLSSAELYDPSTGTWSSAGNMSTARYRHTATLLNSGYVLVAAGYNGSIRLATAELYSYTANSWYMTGSLNNARDNQSATLLPNGKVLVAGGYTGTTQLSTCEIYDPNTSEWALTGSLNSARDMHTATLLSSGLVLVAGGRNESTILSSAELYDPTSETWTVTGSLNDARRSHSAELLLNGQVLAIGGFAPNAPGNTPAYILLASAELYDPVSGTWTLTGSLGDARDVFTATLLPDRQVLVAGGVSSAAYLSSAEVYTPAPRATWTPLVHSPSIDPVHMLLLSDGSVFATDGNSCAKLAPDVHGGYVNGSWTQLASMHYGRVGFASTVLRDGRVFVAGAEFGSGSNSAEVYDPRSDSWTVAPPAPPVSTSMADCIAKILPDGDVLIAPVYPGYGQTIIYQPDSNTWSTQYPLLANGAYDMAEASWVKLPDDSILAIDSGLETSERFIPSQMNWVPDATVPADMWGPATEEGGALLLPSGKAIFFGATGRNAIYTPSGNTSPGSWQRAPNFPNDQGTPDAPAAMMVNGRILCAVSATPKSQLDYPSPTSFYEYDPGRNAFTRVYGPSGLTSGGPPYAMSMLDLPDGTVLLNDGNQNNPPFVYQPDGASLAEGKAVIAGITKNADGTYHLTGTGLNGISEGASYGDDKQMDSNYPLVRMTNNATGEVTYARTFNWSSTGVMTGSQPVSTEFAMPGSSQPGVFSLVAVANGIASDPVMFPYPDALQVSPNQGMTSFGVVGGPFTVSSQDYTLSNWGTASVNWTAVNTASWLTLSSTSGVLPSTGSSTTVNVSLNANAATLPLGTYTTILQFNNVGDGYTYMFAVILYIIAPPVVTTPPTDQAVLDGATATFSVVATGGPPIWYQWQFNGSYLTDNGHVTGSATGSLSIHDASTVDVGTYTVVVGSPIGSTPAYGANLSLIPSAPVITTQPANVSCYRGGSAQFSATAAGTKPFTYQWSFNGVAIPGATGPTLNLSNVLTNQAGCYSLIISNIYGSIASGCGSLTVLPCYPIPSGMASWWRFEGSYSNDSYGTTPLVGAFDPRTAVYLPGVVGQAFLMDSNHYLFVDVPQNSGVDPGYGSGFTFECWIKPSNTYNDPVVEWSIMAPTQTPAALLGINQTGATGSLYADFIDSSNTHHLLTSAGGYVVAGQFQHVALTYDKASGVATLYWNGAAVATGTIQGPSILPANSYMVSLGRDPASSGRYTGLMDEVSVYTRALSASEIQSIFSIGSGGKCAGP